MLSEITVSICRDVELDAIEAPTVKVPKAKRPKGPLPPWLKEKTWVGPDGIASKHDRRSYIRPAKGLEDLLSRPEWRGATVVISQEGLADCAWGPIYIAALSAFYINAPKFYGPSTGRIREVAVVTHPCGAVARILTNP
jgi:hypothetical protein